MTASKRGNVWLGASGLVVNSKGQWLVVRKTYGGLKDKWSIPAGFVNGNETADMTAVREVKEETGLDCTCVGMIGFRTGVLNGEVSDNMAIYLATPQNENQLLVAEQREIAEVAWMTPFELQQDDRTSRMILEMAKKVIETGFKEIENCDPGAEFGYTLYKLFFKQ
jgi:ADP-ribose pyrophosphatase YjhB (NUDIX family)